MRLINADSLIETVKALENKDGEYADSFTNMAGDRAIEFDRLEDYIENAPTVDADPVVHAHWNEDAYGFYSCSACGYEWDDAEYKSKYCPECGAKMDKEETWRQKWARSTRGCRNGLRS